jgi:hypothetical protein
VFSEVLIAKALQRMCQEVSGNSNGQIQLYDLHLRLLPSTWDKNTPPLETKATQQINFTICICGSQPRLVAKSQQIVKLQNQLYDLSSASHRGLVTKTMEIVKLSRVKRNINSIFVLTRLNFTISCVFA